MGVCRLAKGTPGTLSWLTGESSDVVNSFEVPRRVAVQSRPIEAGEGGAFELELPAWTVAVLAFGGA